MIFFFMASVSFVFFVLIRFFAPSWFVVVRHKEGLGWRRRYRW